MLQPADFDLAGKRVWVAGHRGMVGGAVVRRLATENCEVITANRDELDLTDQRAVPGWMHNQRPSAPLAQIWPFNLIRDWVSSSFHRH